MPKHDHPEAFCLMTYKDTAGNLETIWNSRDGVTPFIVRSRAGLESQHVDWDKDRYSPDHKPQIGDRIFEDLTEENCRRWRTEYVDKHLADPECSMAEAYPGMGKEEIVDMLVKEDMKDEHAPQITVVTEEWLNRYLAKKNSPEHEALAHVRALMDALKASKNEFWTSELHAAHKAAEAFLVEKGQRQ